MKYDTRSAFTYDLKENHIESEQSMFGLGFSSQSYTYYSVEKGDEGVSAPFQFVTISFKMSADRENHKRTIYGVWDFLGDVGGLFDMLKIFA